MLLTQPAKTLREQLNAVAWSELNDAHGSAEGIPALVLEALSDDSNVARDAISQVHGRVFHQGVLEESAPMVVPALLELLRIEAVRVKPFILSVLASLAAEFAHVAHVPGLPPRRMLDGESSADDAWKDLARRTWAAVRAGMPIYFDLLVNADASVRAQSGRLLALVADNDDSTCSAALIAAGENESNTLARASHLIALGVLRRGTGGTAVVECCRRSLQDAGLHGAGAIAWVYLGAQPDAVTWQGLRHAGKLGRLDPDLFPWMEGGLASLAAEAFQLLAGADRNQAIDGLLQSLRFQSIEGEERGDDIPHDWPLPDAVAERLLALVFAGMRGGRDLLREELKEEQLRALCELSQLGRYSQSLYALGIPHHGNSLRRFLGLQPSGPQDNVLELNDNGRIESRPIWYWRRAVFKGNLSEAALIHALMVQRSPQALWQLCQDIATGDYDPAAWGPHGPAPLALAIVEQIRPAMFADIVCYATKLLQDPAPSVSRTALAIVPLLQQWQEEGRGIEEPYRPLIEYAVRQGGALRLRVLQFLPEKERLRY